MDVTEKRIASVSQTSERITLKLEDDVHGRPPTFLVIRAIATLDLRDGRIYVDAELDMREERVNLE